MYALLPVSIAGLVFEAIFKGTLIVTFFSLSATKLGTMLGPLVLGTVAGGGGALVDGLEPAFKKGVPKPVWTSAAAAMIFAVLTDPKYGGSLIFDGPIMSPDDATVVVVGALALESIYDKLTAAPAKGKAKAKKS